MEINAPRPHAFFKNKNSFTMDMMIFLMVCSWEKVVWGVVFRVR